MDTVTTYSALVVGAGTAANLLLAAMFIARVTAPHLGPALGFAGTAAAVPLALAAIEAWAAHLGAWEIALPLVFVAFAVEEVVVDVLLPSDIRGTRWVWGYLATFYLAQWAVVGAAFLAMRTGGFVVLASYFICLAATAWSYRRVGHSPASNRGARRPPSSRGMSATGVPRRQ